MIARIRLVIVDDRPRSRDGLKALLATWPSIQVVGEAASGGDAVRLVEELVPDVVLMDIRMPHMDGIDATRIIKRRWPGTRIVAMTLYEQYRADALAGGVDIFLIKGCPPEELMEAIAGGDASPPPRANGD